MNPNDEATVRWALNMSINSQQTQPLQIGYGSGGGEGGEGGEGSGGGGGAGVGAGSSKRRNRNSPRHGDQSKDGYWTYSGHLRCWYHKHKDGRFSLEASFL